MESSVPDWRIVPTKSVSKLGMGAGVSDASVLLDCAPALRKSAANKTNIVWRTVKYMLERSNVGESLCGMRASWLTSYTSTLTVFAQLNVVTS